MEDTEEQIHSNKREEGELTSPSEFHIFPSDPQLFAPEYMRDRFC